MAKWFLLEAGSAHPGDMVLVARDGRTGACVIQAGVLAAELGRTFLSQAFYKDLRKFGVGNGA